MLIGERLGISSTQLAGLTRRCVHGQDDGDNWAVGGRKSIRFMTLLLALKKSSLMAKRYAMVIAAPEVRSTVSILMSCFTRRRRNDLQDYKSQQVA